MDDRWQQGIDPSAEARAARDHKAGDLAEFTFTDEPVELTKLTIPAHAHLRVGDVIHMGGKDHGTVTCHRCAATYPVDHRHDCGVDARVVALLALHARTVDPWDCDACDRPWPCETYRILTGETDV